MPDQQVEVVIPHVVDVEPLFVELLLDERDIFAHDYIGYWARGVPLRRFPSHTGERGWMVIEDESAADELGLFSDEEFIALYEAQEPRAMKHVSRLDEFAALAVIRHGVLTYGLEFQQQYDGDSLDQALQQVLLGKQVYA